MDGFRVMKMIDAAKVGDIFITATGDKHVLTSAHFSQMKDGAFLSNSGHFDIEIDVAYLNDAAKKVDRDVTRNIDAYHLSNGRIVYLLGEGRRMGGKEHSDDGQSSRSAVGDRTRNRRRQTSRNEHQDRHANRRAAQIPGQLGIRHLASISRRCV